MRINKDAALRILLEEAAAADSTPAPREWEERVEALSAACEDSSRTHIAFLGTALLAKATDLRADAFAVKEGAGTPGAYSARTLGHGVLVPNATKLKIDLGVTGREPLNNQPYFRIQRAVADEILPLVRDQAPVQLLLRILDDVEGLKSREEARAALRAFINVRRQHRPEYATLEGQTGQFNIPDVTRIIDAFINENSEGGKRAQAVAAGILSAGFGRDSVEAGRINDPDRHIPGDVGVRLGPETWRMVFEVRDKPVTEADLLLFARKCATEGVPQAGVIAVARAQARFDVAEAVAWAEEVGVCLRVHWQWDNLLRDMAFWTAQRPGDLVEECLKTIHERLIEVEVAVSTADAWVGQIMRVEAPEADLA